MSSYDDEVQVDVTCAITFGGYGFILLAVASFTLFKYLYMRRKEKKEEEKILRENDNDKEEARVLQELFASETRLTMRGKILLALNTSSLGFLWNCLQIFLTLVACYAYVHELYEDPDVPVEFLGLEAFLCIMFVIDMLVNFYAAYDKLWHVLSPYQFFDWISVIPFFIAWGFDDPFLTETDDNTLLFIRSLRCFKAFRAIRLYRLIPVRVDDDAFKRSLTQVIVMFLVLLYVSVCSMQFLEDNLEPIAGLQSNAPFPWHTSLYYMVVTLTTVGYGDITPRTEAGRAVILIFLIWSVSLVPYVVSKLVSIFESINKYEFTSYRVNYRYHHIVIIGQMSGQEFKLFFSEWFHKDNNNQNTRIVIISSQDPDSSLATFLTTSAVRDSVVYIKGSPLDDKTLRARAKLHRAKVCFLILTDPSAAILTYVAIKHVKKDLKVIVRVLGAVSQSHFPLRLGDSTFRPSELRGSLAASCVDLPGISSLIPSLLSALAESDFPRCREGSWRRAYYESIGNELYMLPTPRNLAGTTFSAAAAALYLKHGAILVGATVPLRGPDGQLKKRILLNPLPSFHLREGGILYAIAPDRSFIHSLREEDWFVKDVLNDLAPKKMPKLNIRKLLPNQGARKGHQEVPLDDLIEDPPARRASQDDLIEIEPIANNWNFIDDDPQIQSLRIENWKSTNVSLYEHVVLGTKSDRWREVYSLRDVPKHEEAVVFTPDTFSNEHVRDHVIYIGPTDAILDLIAPLRFQNNPSHPPVVLCLDVEELSEEDIKIACAFDGVYVVQGNGHKIHVLLQIGIERCRHVTIIPNASVQYGVSEDDPYLADADTIFTMRSIQKLYKTIQKPLPTFQVELVFQSNLKFLQDEEYDPAPPLHYAEEDEGEKNRSSSSNSSDYSSDEYDYDEYNPIHKPKTPLMKLLSCFFRWGTCAPCRRGLHNYLNTATAIQPPPSHPLATRGSVFFSDSVMKMLANSFKSNGRINDIVLLLLRQSRSAQALGLSATLRCTPVCQPVFEEFIGKKFSSVFAALCNASPPTILIGLYRRKKSRGDDGGEVGGSTYFVVINPRGETILNQDDRLYMLVNHANEEVFNQNLFDTPHRNVRNPLNFSSRDTYEEFSGEGFSGEEMSPHDMSPREFTPDESRNGGS